MIFRVDRNCIVPGCGRGGQVFEWDERSKCESTMGSIPAGREIRHRQLRLEFLCSPVAVGLGDT